ncbi:MAG: thioredoxin domain-containing protein, partial [Patescibacteria group bacterium]|nr:thioredoxin domain-containing protein [Patescibacteria group bacterium]
MAKNSFHSIHVKEFCLVAISLLVLLSSSCGQIQSKKVVDKVDKYTNHLITETSPYLLQHAHNPVDWYPWGKEALDKAKKENKLLIISIGYAACHWCHVMEHESFEDTIVAKYMNEHFVAIKVDREERPDIDQIYMNAAYIVTGGGGWPLNIIALPDGRPVSAETYLPKKEWMEYLSYYNNAYTKDSVGLSSQASKLVKGISMVDEIPGHSKNDSLYTLSELDQIFAKWKPTIDYKLGGGWGSTKFPMPNSYLYLLNYHLLSKNSDALAAVTSILDNMAKGGIYDQIGGGF